jgi:cell division transport system permease protein
MALKLDYVVKETGTNLGRNVTLTLATIVTIAVSLAFVGVSLLVRKGVENATLQWKGDVQFIVFMQPTATEAQIAAVRDDLGKDPQVKKFVYLDHDAAYAEFLRLFKDSPDLTDNVTAADLPTNFKVSPKTVDFRVIDGLRDTYSTKPAVLEVKAADDAIKTMQRVSGVISVMMFVASIVLALASIALTFNTIRTAMFARRREIEVMKLVGATNWFIRVPFMLEGLVQGVVGSLVGVAAVFGVNAVFHHFFANGKGLELLRTFVVETGDVWGTSAFIIVIGCVVGVLGSAIAVTRFLDV